MQRRLLMVALMLACGIAQAKTEGRVIVMQDADADMKREALNLEFPIGQAFAWTEKSFDEAHYEIALFPPDADITGLAASTDPERWHDEYVRSGKRSVTVSVEPDGDAISMYMRADGKVDLGAGGTMGKVYGLAKNGDRVSGHYVYFDDLFGNDMAIDVNFDAPLWKAPAAKAAPTKGDGGEAGKAYLALIAAIKAGDEAKIRSLQTAEQAAQMPSSEFKQILPLLQAMMPDDAKVVASSVLPTHTELKVEGKSDGQPYHANVEMVQEGGKWVMKSSSSGTLAEAAPPAPTPAGGPADKLPLLAKSGLYTTTFPLGEAPFTPKHALAIRRPGSEELIEQFIVVLSEVPLLPENMAGLWSDDVPVQKFYKGSPRSALLMFNVADDGSLEALEGYYIDTEGNFNKEFAMRGAAFRYGDRLLGQYIAEHYDQETSENVLDGAARFDLKFVDAKP